MARSIRLLALALVVSAGLAAALPPPGAGSNAAARPLTPLEAGPAIEPAEESVIAVTAQPAATTAVAGLLAGRPQDSTRGTLDTAAAAAAAAFVWPVAGPVVVVRRFDLPDKPWLAGHRGVDLTASPGTKVLAPAEGQIRFNGWIVDRHVVVIEHGELASTLEPVISDLAVGARLIQGQAVGEVPSGEAWHCPNCLHWGVRRGDQYIDPALLVEPRPRAVLWR
jgi:murein DD-endopeptidase MepM/ murein hydrolase activator NlpD